LSAKHKEEIVPLVFGPLATNKHCSSYAS